MIVRKPIELPPAVARAFIEAMNGYFAEPERTSVTR
jgi:hypothetical protein